MHIKSKSTESILFSKNYCIEYYGRNNTLSNVDVTFKDPKNNFMFFLVSVLSSSVSWYMQSIVILSLFITTWFMQLFTDQNVFCVAGFSPPLHVHTILCAQ